MVVITAYQNCGGFFSLCFSVITKYSTVNNTVFIIIKDMLKCFRTIKHKGLQVVKISVQTKRCYGNSTNPDDTDGRVRNQKHLPTLASPPRNKYIKKNHFGQQTSTLRKIIILIQLRHLRNNLWHLYAINYKFYIIYTCMDTYISVEYIKFQVYKFNNFYFLGCII